MCEAQLLVGALTTEAKGSVVDDPLYSDNIGCIGLLSANGRHNGDQDLRDKQG